MAPLSVGVNLRTHRKIVKATTGIRQPSSSVARIGIATDSMPLDRSANPPLSPMAKSKTNEIESKAPLEIERSDLTLLAMMPRANAKTGTLVRLEVAMSNEFTGEIIQEFLYRKQKSVILKTCNGHSWVTTGTWQCS